MVYVNSVFSISGLRATATRNDPNTVPMPTPAPISEIVASPAAIIFAASIIILQNKKLSQLKLDRPAPAINLYPMGRTHATDVVVTFG